MTLSMTPNKKKLVIENKTKWATRDLKRVFLAVLNDSIKHEGPHGHTIRARVSPSRSKGMSGYAYFNSGSMKIRLPNPNPDSPLDVFRVGWLFDHELAHCRGQKHKTMGVLNHSSHGTAENYPYLKGLTINPQVKKPKPPLEDRKAARQARLDALLRKWLSKASRADRAIRKLRKAIRRASVA